MRKRVHRTPDERSLAERWAGAGGTVKTNAGDQVDVLYPGRPNPDAGPDFVDAVLGMPQGVVRGAVELHRQTGDWERHGHSADPNYSAVVLHVVAKHDGASGTLPGGRQLPLVDLGDPGNAAGLSPLSPFPCAVARERGADLCAPLRVAGRRRFEASVTDIAAQIADETARGGASATSATSAEQVVYERIAAALGYSRNSEPMRDLARALPLAEMRAAAAAGRQDARLATMEAIYLGTAGLLPSQRHLSASRRRDAYAETLERDWQESGLPAALRAYRWDFGRSRPENAPTRRVIALAQLTLRWPATGMLRAAATCLREETPAATRRLAAQVALPGQSGYWADHWDLGLSARAAGDATALIGPSRAADIVVNVLLPAIAAAGAPGAPGAPGGDTDLPRRARRAFTAHPPLAENWITRVVRERTGLNAPAAAGAADPVDSAAIQQGLIAIYEGPCAALRCVVCPLSGAGTSEGGAEHGTGGFGESLERGQV